MPNGSHLSCLRRPQVAAYARFVRLRMKPRSGQHFRAIRDTPVNGVVILRAPATGGFRATLPRGELVMVETDPPSHATAVYAKPVRYREMEHLLLPPGEVKGQHYDSYALVISFESLDRDFEL